MSFNKCCAATEADTAGVVFRLLRLRAAAPALCATAAVLDSENHPGLAVNGGFAAFS